ncbi:epl1 protein [Moniliophthora roreri MCA 2997]|uniref:Epl1 protein n=3 Tax=Moniliophthora roreri TaxID=221103 RepID=V2XES1_MONRO|nr:cerato-platanin 9 [Moniliophthora roreri]ESK92202.1 epl1 protein [Moniliophthora roreri MCA 2997]
MKFFSLCSTLALVSSTMAVNLAWDNAYNDPAGSLNAVACSDGENGLETRFNFATFGDIPTFPFVGGAPNIPGWNSSACGTCWALTFINSTGTHTINFTAIDAGGDDFVTGRGALDLLTNGQAEQLGVIPVNATAVSASPCGL